MNLLDPVRARNSTKLHSAHVQLFEKNVSMSKRRPSCSMGLAPPRLNPESFPADVQVQVGSQPRFDKLISHRRRNHVVPKFFARERGGFLDKSLFPLVRPENKYMYFSFG